MWNGDQRISDPTVMVSQGLAESDFATNTKWAASVQAGSATFSFSGGKAVFSNPSTNGIASITQVRADLLTPGLPDRYYSFSYTVSSVTGTPECHLERGWDQYGAYYLPDPETNPLHKMDMTPGIHGLGSPNPAFFFRSKSVKTFGSGWGDPVDFVISCYSTNPATVSFDDLFLYPSVGGNLTTDGDISVNGRLKSGMGATLYVDGAQCYMGTCIVPGWFDSHITTYMSSEHCVSAFHDCHGGNFFILSGTTPVDCLSTGGWNPGNRILFRTDGNLTLNDNASCTTWPAPNHVWTFGKLHLAGAANVSMTANDMIEFVLDDALEWNQVAPVLVK